MSIETGDQPAAPIVVPAATATQLARHLKAALLHLLAAEDLVEDADVVDLDADDTLARLFRRGREAAGDLDLWAITTAQQSGATRAIYDDTEHWCHQPGGTLPT